MIKLFRHITDFLLFSNLWVALCLSVLVLGIAHHYCIDDCLLFAAFTFFATFVTYTFHRIVRNKAFLRNAIRTERMKWQIRRQNILLAICILGAIAGACIFFYLPVNPVSFVMLGFCGLIVLFYAIPFPFTSFSLRSIPFLKNYWISVVWIIIVSIPMINRHKDIEPLDLVIAGIFTFAQIIPFDIRDLEFDSKKMNTIPQVIGRLNAQLISSLLVLLAAFLFCFLNDFQAAILFPIAVAMAGIWIPQRESNLRYLELLWDGALLFLGISYYLLPCNQL